MRSRAFVKKQGTLCKESALILIWMLRSVYKELHADHKMGC